MVTFLCSICQEDYPFSTLRCLPCGHAFCAECVERCITVNKQTRDRNGRLKTRFPCPSCRADFKASDPHPIYVENSDFTPQGQAEANGPAPCHTDAVHRRIQSALREVRHTEHDLRRQTVQKAAQEMDRVVEVSDGKDNCLLVCPRGLHDICTLTVHAQPQSPFYLP
ncbi:hypothetical protein BD413DRAFT_234966 [Trametes elegans]|nr:hypothetical protein BD413DRAFT_234966 [Trametes elegans]